MEKERDNSKKQVPLRLSAKLYAEIAAWAEDEFLSVNVQIESPLSTRVTKTSGRGKDDGAQSEDTVDGGNKI